MSPEFVVKYRDLHQCLKTKIPRRNLKLTTEQVITQDPEIHGGLPVFTGARVPVKSLIDHLKAGENLDYFLEGFPSVSRQQAVAFFRNRIDHSHWRPLAWLRWMRLKNRRASYSMKTWTSGWSAILTQIFKLRRFLSKEPERHAERRTAQASCRSL